MSLSCARGDLATVSSDAQQYLLRGDRDRAMRALDQALDEFSRVADDPSALPTMRQVAQNYRSLGARRNAQKILSRLIESADTTNPGLVAPLLVELGDIQVEAEEYSLAADTYQSLLKKLSDTDHQQHTRLLTRLLAVQVRSNDNPAEIASTVNSFRHHAALIPEAMACSEGLAFAANLLRSSSARSHSAIIRDLLDKSMAYARANNLTLDMIYALGFSARLAEVTGDLDQALELARRALFLSRNDMPELAYRWVWTVGRIMAQQGKADKAIDNYRLAVSLLNGIKAELLNESVQTFRERVVPVYSEFLVLLLDRAASASDITEQQALFAEIQQTIESFNESEVLDYFVNDCVLPTHALQLGDLPNDMAVVYQFVLDRQLVILARFPERFVYYRVDVDRNEISALAAEFRSSLVDLVDEEELKDIGLELYEYLIAPLSRDLARQNTKRLLFISSASLRTIPMAALYDGQKYLIEDYEISSTLGLGLTDGSTAAREPVKQARFFGGVSEAVDDFSALPGVTAELTSIRASLTGDLVLDAAFTVENAAELLSSGGYSSVHIATHGVFDREASSSFLLAYDGKFSLDRLQSTIGARRYLDKPIDLLVLSACETAAGDEKAALGLAGVSLKAGARTTVASLWEISDEATTEIMTSFYRNLKAEIPKGEALRNAQLSLARSEVFSHPNFWSPFVMIGRWD
ncbi:MAG: CHAT domain-containing protein [Pseudomonadota bacterium]